METVQLGYGRLEDNHEGPESKEEGYRCEGEDVDVRIRWAEVTDFVANLGKR